MTRKKHPDDLIVKPFTVDDRKILRRLYGKVPTKELVPMMTYAHPIGSIWALAHRMGLSEDTPHWTPGEDRLIAKAEELGMPYTEIVRIAHTLPNCRVLSVPAITQHKYRQREAVKRSLDTEHQG